MQHWRSLCAAAVARGTARRAIVVMLLLGVALPLSGCIVEGGGGGRPGWCYWHPERCR